MSVFAYIRVSKETQNSANQLEVIMNYVESKGIVLNGTIDVTASALKTKEQRKILDLFSKLKAEDTLIITELSRIGRSTAEVINIVNIIIGLDVRLISIKEGLNFNQHDTTSKVLVAVFGLLSELERDLISQRTKEALALRKKNGLVNGKPKGTIQSSKYDKDIDKIKDLLKLGVSVSKISKVHLKEKSPINLYTYLKKRNINY